MSQPPNEIDSGKPKITITIDREYCGNCRCEGCMIIHRLEGREPQPSIEEIMRQLEVYRKYFEAARPAPYWNGAALIPAQGLMTTSTAATPTIASWQQLGK